VPWANVRTSLRRPEDAATAPPAASALLGPAGAFYFPSPETGSGVRLPRTAAIFPLTAPRFFSLFASSTEAWLQVQAVPAQDYLSPGRECGGRSDGSGLLTIWLQIKSFNLKPKTPLQSRIKFGKNTYCQKNGTNSTQRETP